MRNSYSIYCVNLNRTDHLGDPGMGGRITPKWNLSIMMRTGFNWLRMKVSGVFLKPRIYIRVPYRAGNLWLSWGLSDPAEELFSVRLVCYFFSRGSLLKKSLPWHTNEAHKDRQANRLIFMSQVYNITIFITFKINENTVQGSSLYLLSHKSTQPCSKII
jgi:hypothetical protein